MPIADKAAVSEPASKAMTSGPAMLRKRFHWANNGAAKATVAGPSMKWISCAPAK